MMNHQKENDTAHSLYATVVREWWLRVEQAERKTFFLK